MIKDVLRLQFLYTFTSSEKKMKNYSIRLILLVLLVFVGPTIQEMLVGSQQKGHFSTPISDTEQASFEEESEELNGQLICSFFMFFKHIKLPQQFTFQASFRFFRLTDKIVLPPPQLVS